MSSATFMVVSLSSFLLSAQLPSPMTIGGRAASGRGETSGENGPLGVLLGDLHIVRRNPAGPMDRATSIRTSARILATQFAEALSPPCEAMIQPASARIDVDRDCLRCELFARDSPPTASRASTGQARQEPGHARRNRSRALTIAITSATREASRSARRSRMVAAGSSIPAQSFMHFTMRSASGFSMSSQRVDLPPLGVKPE